jgi:hypothetical protein
MRLARACDEQLCGTQFVSCLTEVRDLAIAHYLSAVQIRADCHATGLPSMTVLDVRLFPSRACDASQSPE